MTEAKKKQKATDAAERRAEQLDVDLAAVKGTGYEDQVTVEDVERAAHARSESASSGPGNSGNGSNNGSNGDDGEKIAEAINAASVQLTKGLQDLEQAVESTKPESVPLTPGERDIVNQYGVLWVTLAGPETDPPAVPLPSQDWRQALGAKDFVPLLPPAIWKPRPSNW